MHFFLSPRIYAENIITGNHEVRGGSQLNRMHGLSEDSSQYLETIPPHEQQDDR